MRDDGEVWIIDNVLLNVRLWENADERCWIEGECRSKKLDCGEGR